MIVPDFETDPDPENDFEYVYTTPSILHNTGPVHYVGGNTGSGYALRNNKTNQVYLVSMFLIPESHSITDLDEYYKKYTRIAFKRKREETEEEWNVTELTTEDTKTAQMLLQFNPEKTFVYLLPSWSSFALRRKLSTFSGTDLNYLSFKHYELFRMFPTPLDYSIPRFCYGRVLMYKLPEAANKFDKIKEPDLTNVLSHRGDEGFNLYLTILNSEKEKKYIDFFVRLPFIPDCSEQEQDIVRVFSSYCPEIVDVKTVTVPLADFVRAGQDNSIHYSKMAYFAETEHPTLWEELWKPYFDSVPSPMLFEFCNCADRDPTITRIRIPYEKSSKKLTSLVYNVLMYDNFTMKHWIVVSTRCNTLLRGVRRTPVRNRRPSQNWLERLSNRGGFGEPDCDFFKKVFWKYSDVFEECMSQSSAMTVWAQETFSNLMARFEFKNIAENIFYAYKLSSVFFSNMAFSMLPCKTDWEKFSSWEEMEKSFPHFCFKNFSYNEIRDFVLKLDTAVDQILLPPEYVRFSSQATIVGDRIFFWSSLGSFMDLKDSKSTYGHATLLKNLQVYENVTQTVPVIDIETRILYSKWIQQWMCRIGKVWCILYGRQCDRIDYGILKFASFPADDSVIKSSKFTFQCPFLSYVKQSIMLRGVGFDSFSRLDSKNTQCYMLPSHWKECVEEEKDEKEEKAKENLKKLKLPKMLDSSCSTASLGTNVNKIKVSVKMDTTFTFGWIEMLRNDHSSGPSPLEVSEPEPEMAPSIDWMSQMNSLNMFSGVAAFRTTVNEFKTLAVYRD